MATIVKVKAPSQGISAEMEVEFGSNVAEAVELFGESVVFDRYIRGIKVEAQGAARTMLVAGKSVEEVTNYMANTWKPGEGVDPMSAFMLKLQKASPKEKAQMLAALEAEINEE